MSITTKFTAAFALLLALIMLLAITSYTALTIVQQQTETAILKSTNIQSVILKMDSGLEEARRMQRDYFLRYSTFGFSKDRYTYVRQTKERISDVISLSKELQQLIAASDVGHALRDSQVNLNFYLSSANRYLETFNEAAELITGLTKDETGLQAQLVKNSTLLLASLKHEGNHLLIDLYQNMQLHEKDYWITRQRPAMQSSFNVSGRLRQAVVEMPGIGRTQKSDIFSYLDKYLSIAKEILRFDVAVRSKFNEFELQVEALEPVSSELITLAGVEIERARAHIDETGQLATGILVVISLLGLTLVIIIARVLNKDITRNVVKLTEKARELHDGKLDVQVQIDSADELGQLADTFNAMTSEIKAKVDELVHLRSMLKNIIDSMPSSLVAVDKDGRVIEWNNMASKFTGVSMEQARGKLLPDVFPRLGSEMGRVREAIRNRRAEHNSKAVRKINNDTYYEDVTIYPLIANGVEGAVIRVDDVTERVRIEEMMIQTEKMLSVGGLAAGMAHEINNPLGGIMQNAAVIIRRLTEDLPANRRAAEECGTNTETIRAYMEKRGIPRMLDLVRESGSRAAEIVQNMLSFSRKSESSQTSEDLAELLDNTVELASSDYDLKKKYDFRLIEIVREYDRESPQVHCEAGTIQQVFLNLLKNGAEAMFGQGDKARPSRFILRVMPENGMVRVEIEDSGPGIDEAMQKRVFEPFFTTKPVGFGTGLGLSVSYFIIVEHHGGKMDVDSSPGKGTKFIVRLPAEREKV